jgi:hypothetical protein
MSGLPAGQPRHGREMLPVKKFGISALGRAYAGE